VKDDAALASVRGEGGPPYRPPKLVCRIVWRGSIECVDCVRGVALNGKFQTLTLLTEVVFDHAA
jgi:hypothetical protein